MRKVLIVSKYFYPFESGSEKTTRYIIDYLLKRNYNVILFCLKGDSQKLSEKVVFYSIKNFEKFYDRFSKKKILKEILDTIFGFVFIFKIILKEKVKVINVHYAEGVMLPAVILGKIFSIKTVILWPTSSVNHLKKYEKKIVYIYSKISSKISDLFIAKGMDEVEIKKIFKVNSKRLVSTPNPIEQKDYDLPFPEKSEKLGIYYLGKYNGFKRPDILVRALAKMKLENRRKIFVSLYGEGDYKSKVDDLVKKLDLERIVTVNPPTRDVKGVIKNHHIFVYPSPFEPAFAQSILESFSAGRLVVCKKTKAMERYFNEDSYFGLEKMDSSSLSKILDWIVENYEKEKVKGIKAKKIIIEKFNFDYFMDILEECLS